MPSPAHARPLFDTFARKLAREKLRDAHRAIEHALAVQGAISSCHAPALREADRFIGCALATLEAIKDEEACHG